jgi:hypothetical protein
MALDPFLMVQPGCHLLALILVICGRVCILYEIDVKVFCMLSVEVICSAKGFY